jgi:hypothetical protein
MAQYARYIGTPDQPAAAVHVGLAPHAGDMLLNSTEADAEFLGDLPVVHVHDQ